MLPGVRSLAQQGFAEFEALGWLALLGRAGTPDQNVRKMSESMSQDLIGTEICERIAVPGVDVVGGAARSDAAVSSTTRSRSGAG